MQEQSSATSNSAGKCIDRKAGGFTTGFLHTGEVGQRWIHHCGLPKESESRVESPPTTWTAILAVRDGRLPRAEVNFVN